MAYTSCTDSESGFSVINCYTAELPGLTCNPVIAKEVAAMVIDRIVVNASATIFKICTTFEQF